MTFAPVGTSTIYYEQKGDSGPPLLFIQGVGVIGHGWKPQIDGLSSTHRTLTFDNRGLGKSAASSRDKLTIEQMADDACAVLDAAGWDSAHVVGHSMGGVIAQRLALKHRSRVRSLSLLCTVSRGADATALSGRMLVLGIRTRLGTRAMRRRAFLEMIFAPEYLVGRDLDALATDLVPLFGRDLADSPPIILKQLGALRAHDCTAELAALLDLPTLVVSARHDPIANQASGRRLAQAIAGAKYVQIDDASHALPIQQAAHVNEILATFIGAVTKAS